MNIASPVEVVLFVAALVVIWRAISWASSWEWPLNAASLLAWHLFRR